jgi:ribonucleoside-diphosphate reductase subunit M1
MRVKNRKGEYEDCRLDAVTERIKKACSFYSDLNQNVIDPVFIATKVCNNMKDGITTIELDEISIGICMNLSLVNQEFGTLGSRIAINNHQKTTDFSFSDAMKMLYNNIDKNNKQSPKISKRMFDIVNSHGHQIDTMIHHSRDYLINFFGFKTLERSYFSKIGSRSVETPQFLWMRVALGIWDDDIEKAQNTYELLSMKYFTHATPTLFNSGTPNNNLLSCFLIGTGDSVHDIFNTIHDCAMISKVAGGIGVHISNIRSRNSYVRGTGGKSDGILPMLRVYNDTAEYINQGDRRKGSFAMYIEPWHADVVEFLYSKRNQGIEAERARDLFYALWVPDLFMERVEQNEVWSLMCPDECPGLSDSYGQEFKDLYESYEKDKKYRKQLKAREIWNILITTQIETGMPYMCYKDSFNMKSNQMNIGTIKSSNLCAEIALYSDKNQYACCNLASVRLHSFLVPSEHTMKMKNSNIRLYGKKDCKYCSMAIALFVEHDIKYKYISLDDNELRELFFTKYNVKTVPQIFVDTELIGGFSNLLDLVRPTIDYNKMRTTVHTIVENLNRIIDINYYPVEQTRISNLSYRPIGIGVQGLADVFMSMWLPFDSPMARKINVEIFETLYYSAVEKSMLLSRERKDLWDMKELVFNKYESVHTDYPGAYNKFYGSPLQTGKFQFDLWNVIPSDRYNWKSLMGEIQKYGVRNSTLIALMPTASTAQILNSVEAFEPISSNMYIRRTLAGEFKVVNEYLMKVLYNMNMWDEKMKYRIMHYRGSIQEIKQIPTEIREIFKTAYEIKQKSIIDMAVDRGAFVCQSQSLNIFINEQNPEKFADILTKVHFHGWKKGLKTGSYYIRSKAAVDTQTFTLTPDLEEEFRKESFQNENETCMSCGS